MAGRMTLRIIHPIRDALIGGSILGLVTGPAPLMHDKLVGRGTWVAAQVTHTLGHGHHATGQPQQLSTMLRIIQQVGAGIPIYVALLWISLVLIGMIQRIPAAGS
ncbi:MAG TPA: hypothetical protein VGJ86_23390 [Acidimicrobiales bacterium]